MPSISYRRLDSNWDYTYGNGRGCYLHGVEAVAQAVRSRLLLFLEEWWADRNDGLPMWQAILGIPGAGTRNKEMVDRLIQERILGTPHVTRIVSLDSTYNPNTRSYTFTAVIDTAFGQAAVSNVPFAIGAGGR